MPRGKKELAEQIIPKLREVTHASMPGAAAASRKPRSLNHLTTRRRTRSVRAARSAAVIDRAGRNTGGASALCRNTPSVTHACRWTWRLRAEPKRWTKETAPSRGHAALGVSSSHVAPAAASKSRSISSRKTFVSELTGSGRSARKQRSRLGNEITTAGRTPAG